MEENSERVAFFLRITDFEASGTNAMIDAILAAWKSPCSLPLSAAIAPEEAYPGTAENTSAAHSPSPEAEVAVFSG